MKEKLNSYQEEREFYTKEFDLLRKWEKILPTKRVERMIKTIKKEIISAHLQAVRTEKSEFEELLNENIEAIKKIEQEVI